VEIRRRTFVAEATARFAFLLTDHGFVGPEVEQSGEYPLLLRVRYHRIEVDVEETLILYYGGEETVSADLVFTDEVSGALTRETVSTHTAHTGYQMRRALDLHARELNNLLAAKDASPGQDVDGSLIHASGGDLGLQDGRPHAVEAFV